MISNDLLREKILDSAIHGTLVENDFSLPPVDVEPVTEDVPFNIPSNWKWVELTKCADFNAGKTPSTKDPSYWGTDVHWVSISDMKHRGTISSTSKSISSKALFKTFNNRIVPVGTLLMSFKLTIGRLSVTGIECVHNEAIISLYPKDCLLKDYLLDALDGLDLEKNVKNAIKGKTLNSKSISSILIPIPPLEEQKRIVTKIDELFELIDQKDNNDKERARLKDILKNKILDSAIHGTLVENNLLLPPVDIEAVTEDIPFNIPSNWKWTMFDSISVIVRGGSPRPIKDYLTDSNDGINWIKIGDTNPNEYYINSVKEKIKPEGMHKSRFVEKGSLLLTNSMSFGRPYILNVDGCIHDGWLNIKDRDNYFDNMYMVYLLSSKYFYNVMCDKSSGAVVSNLNIDKVKSLKIPLPPLEEQKRIVAKIEECFDLIDKL